MPDSATLRCRPERVDASSEVRSSGTFRVGGRALEPSEGGGSFSQRGAAPLGTT